MFMLRKKQYICHELPDFKRRNRTFMPKKSIRVYYFLDIKVQAILVGHPFMKSSTISSQW